MKYSLLLFFIFSFFISNAQLGKNRIKLGAQVIRTPYLLKPGFGYQGEYEFIFGNRYAVAFRISQAVGKEKTDDLVMNIPNKEGVNSLEISILSRIFNKSDRNHFKIGSGFSFQSIWVKYSKVVGFNFSVLEYENKKEITNIVMANFCIQNDFYFMPDLFLTTKFIAHMPIYFPENTGFSRYVPPYGSSGKVMRGARLHMSGAIIVGVGYRF